MFCLLYISNLCTPKLPVLILHRFNHQIIKNLTFKGYVIFENQDIAIALLGLNIQSLAGQAWGIQISKSV